MKYQPDIDRYYGVKKGDLVKVRDWYGTDDPPKYITGIVLDVYPANVYEHSEAVVLVGTDDTPERITIRTNYLTLLETP
jgi:hypothetical protein